MTFTIWILLCITRRVFSLALALSIRWYIFSSSIWCRPTTFLPALWLNFCIIFVVFLFGLLLLLLGYSISKNEHLHTVLRRALPNVNCVQYVKSVKVHGQKKKKRQPKWKEIKARKKGIGCYASRHIVLFLIDFSCFIDFSFAEPRRMCLCAFLCMLCEINNNSHSSSDSNNKETSKHETKEVVLLLRYGKMHYLTRKENTRLFHTLTFICGGITLTDTPSFGQFSGSIVCSIYVCKSACV